MAFILEWVENTIRLGMEDPVTRDEKFAGYVRSRKAKAEELKEAWAHPVKPYGYWNSDKNNHKLLLDMKLSNLSGRKDPYDLPLKDKYSS